MITLEKLDEKREEISRLIEEALFTGVLEEECLDKSMSFRNTLFNFAQYHHVEIDYWVFSSLTIFIETLESIFYDYADLLCYAQLLWDEKFADNFECWYHVLTERGLHVCEDFDLFTDNKKALTVSLQNALSAETLFFSFDRNRHKNALVPFREQLRSNRKTQNKTTTIDAQQLSGRQLISVQIAAVHEDIKNANPIELTQSSRLSEVLGWYKTKSKNWNRETVSRGVLDYDSCPRALTIKYQFQPVPGQLANIRTSGVGQYGYGKSGKTPNILAVFYKLTKEDNQKEQRLAKLLIRYKHGEGMLLEAAVLKANSLDLPPKKEQQRTLIEQLNKAAYLICFQEVYRRKNQGFQNRGGSAIPVRELPFGVAVSCALKLISDGHLSFKQVFSKDSNYGVFTGVNIMSENINKTHQKFITLFQYFSERYSEHYSMVWDYSDITEASYVACTPQFFHKLLRETDGGENDSDNEEYLPVALNY